MSRLARAALSAEERRLRSRLAHLVHDGLFLRGHLSERWQTCGRPACPCAGGQRHEALYVALRRQGQTRQYSIPRPWREEIRQQVAIWQEIQQLLDEVSELAWQRLAARKQTQKKAVPPFSVD